MIAFAIVTSLEPLAHIDKLPPQRRQGSENTYVFMWKFSPRLRSGYHEPGDEFGIDPGKRERLDLWLFRDLCGWAVFRSCAAPTRCCGIG